MDYHRVCRSGQVPEGLVRRMVVDDVEVAVCRSDGEVHATSNYCTHLDCLLSSGKATDEGLLCSCHGSVFDYTTGEPLCPPATRPIAVFPVREDDGDVWIGIDDELRAAAARRRAAKARRLIPPNPSS